MTALGPTGTSRPTAVTDSDTPYDHEPLIPQSARRSSTGGPGDQHSSIQHHEVLFSVRNVNTVPSSPQAANTMTPTANPTAFVWLLTAVAGLSGLLFGCTWTCRFYPSYYSLPFLHYSTF